MNLDNAHTIASGILAGWFAYMLLTGGFKVKK
jgi:hypothetical protein